MKVDLNQNNNGAVALTIPRIVVMHQLTATEVTVLKAVFHRNLQSGFQAIEVQGIDPFSASVAIGTLFELGLVDANRAMPSGGQPGVWMAGNVTERGIAWLDVYGLKR